MKRKKGYFSISAVAKMFSVHQQTVRLYEREGLITPKRSEGNTRLFSEEDVDKLEEVIYLTHQLGINLAGVEMILKLKRQIKKMQNDMNRVFESASDELTQQEESSKEQVKQKVVQLALIKKENNAKKLEKPAALGTRGKLPPKEQQSLPLEENDNWEIDYED